MLEDCCPFIELLAALYFSMVIDNLFMRPMWEMNYYKQIHRQASIFSFWIEKAKRPVMLRTAKAGLKQMKSISRLRGKIMFSVCALLIFASVSKTQLDVFRVPYREILVILSCLSVSVFIVSYLFLRRLNFLLFVLAGLLLVNVLAFFNVLDLVNMFHCLTIAINGVDADLARFVFLSVLAVPVIWHFSYSTILMSTYVPYLELSLVRERRLRFAAFNAINYEDLCKLPKQYRLRDYEVAMDFNMDWFYRVIERRLVHNTRPSLLRFFYLLFLTPDARTKNYKKLRRLFLNLKKKIETIVSQVLIVKKILVKLMHDVINFYIAYYFKYPPYL